MDHYNGRKSRIRIYVATAAAAVANGGARSSPSIKFNSRRPFRICVDVFTYTLKLKLYPKSKKLLYYRIKEREEKKKPPPNKIKVEKLKTVKMDILKSTVVVING